MDKIQKIESITNTEFISVFKTIILSLGYENVTQIEENKIKATYNSPLNTENKVFINFPYKLSGLANIDDEKAIIKKEFEEKNISSVYIVCKHVISKGFRKTIDEEISNVNYIDRDNLIQLIDEHSDNFWRHDDKLLIEYETEFLNISNQESELKKLSVANEKYQKILDIYIEPIINYQYEDFKTKTPIQKKVGVDFIIEKSTKAIISGGAGVGKSTFLKKIGKKLIEINSENKENKRKIPVFIDAQKLYNNDYSIEKTTNNLINKTLGREVSKLYDKYEFYILIDSIDEFDEKTQRKLINELNDLQEKFNVKFFICTRNGEAIETLLGDKETKSFSINRFNTEQIKRFISTFFTDSREKADNLIEALKENKIIDKLPITPLTLSLVSILYEENNFEIPATITDIYDNFNTLIIGKSLVGSKIELIDISFKERILSLYAYELLNRKDNNPLTKDDFIDFFISYFEGKTIPVKSGNLKELLEYLIKNTGILYIKDHKWIQFSHDSYMEYYAAIEIFKHQRLEKEPELVDNFFDVHWQNCAIFYAGKSKDMPSFLDKINNKIRESKNITEYLSGVLGTGYLLQALYQTDNVKRCNSIIEALELIVKANDVFKQMAGNNAPMFKNYSMPILQLLNVLFFYESFNSITLRDPLILAFKELVNQYKTNKNATIGYKMIQLAFTLDSKRINNQDALEEVMELDILRDPSLNVMMTLALDLLGKKEYKKLKKEFKKKYQSLDDVNKKVAELPASKLRFTNLDTISSSKKVTLIVEGKTDAEIIEHAYTVLTDGELPYWRIKVAGNNKDAGGANEVNKVLSSAHPLVEPDSFVIGIFDHDTKGVQEFNGLKKNDFKEVTSYNVKKHKLNNIFGLCLPIPGELAHYINKEQRYNYFEIEHYFKEDLLRENKMLKETPISDIYEINDNRKNEFIKVIKKIYNPQDFEQFLLLFEKIDEITNVKIDYII